MKISLTYDTETKRYQIQVDGQFKDEQQEFLESLKSFRGTMRKELFDLGMVGEYDV